MTYSCRVYEDRIDTTTQKKEKSDGRVNVWLYLFNL